MIRATSPGQALARAVLISLLATAVVPAVAAAHAGDPNIDTLVTGTQPSLPGVTITTIQSAVAPALSAVNESSSSLEVLGPDGLPFLRLGPGGAFGNADSPTFYIDSAPSGETLPPSGLGRLRGQVRWVRLSGRPAWAWYDARVPDIATAPVAAQNRATPTVLAAFTIPLHFGGAAARATGEVDYRPPRGGQVATMTSPMALAPGITVALLPGASPGIFVQNSGPLIVTIEGQQGEPFAQIGPHGVRVNVRSPIHAADVVARGGSAPVRLEGAASPLWRLVSTTPTYDWLDPRPRFEPSWRIPIRIGPRTYDITGTRSFQPATTIPGLLRRTAPRRASSAGVPAWLIVALAVLGLVAAGLGVRRLRQRLEP